MASTQSEENMAEEGEEPEQIFPVLNRRTPILDRIRGNGRGNTLAFKVGRLAGESVMNDDQEQLSELADNAKGDFKRGAAEVLGVNPEDINDETAEVFAELAARLDETDILSETALSSLGLDLEDEESVEEEEVEEEDENTDEVDPEMVEEGEDVDPSGMF